MTSQEHIFETSTRTIDEYKRAVNPNMKPDEHAQWLMETVAQSTKGWIVKRERSTGFYYEECSDILSRYF